VGDAHHLEHAVGRAGAGAPGPRGQLLEGDLGLVAEELAQHGQLLRREVGVEVGLSQA
jgi:hypothetical protein